MYSNNANSVVNLARLLIRINSENPINTELLVQEFVHEFLSDLGFQLELIEYDTDRNNIVAFFLHTRSCNCNYTFLDAAAMRQ